MTYLSLFLLAASLMACAPVDFKNDGGSSSLSIDADSTPDEGGDDDGGGGGGSVPVTGNEPIYPEITLKIPNNCVSNSTCVIQASLSRKDAKSVSFSWATDDDAYLAKPALARPNVHYVPTSGLVQFNPSEEQKPMPFQTLDKFLQIDVPFEWWSCKYDGKPIHCDVYKFKLVKQ